MSALSPLWLFAHKALSQTFHEDPARFVAVLDGNAAPLFIERLWTWALSAAGQQTPKKPALNYDIDRPRPGLAVVWMHFADVTSTGDPWIITFFVREPDPGQANGYTRMFLLEHDAYATEREGRPTAIPCESLADGAHSNFGVALAPDDEEGFYRVIVEVLKRGAQGAQGG